MVTSGVLSGPWKSFGKSKFLGASKKNYCSIANDSGFVKVLPRSAPGGIFQNSLLRYQCEYSIDGK